MTEPPSTDQQADAGPLLGSAAPSLEALRDAVVHAAGELAPAAADSDGAPLSSGGRGGSPAAGAGITRNSVITAVAGTQISTLDDLSTTLLAHKPGDRVSITWVNHSGTHTAMITLGGVNP